MLNSRFVNNTGSLANSYGITRGNPQDSSMGLNPNLNIEDEYIENLLKQINFLGLEIKLLKQKQGENKNLGIMGLLNRDQQPLVNHAVESNMKFQSMKGNLQVMVSELQTQNFLLEDQNTALNSQKQFLQEELKKQQQKNFDHRMDVEKQIAEASEKLKGFSKRYEDLRTQHKKLSNVFSNTSDEHIKTLRSEKIKALLNEVNNNLKKQEEDASQQVMSEKGQITKSNRAKWDAAQQDFRKDPRYVELSSQNQKLKEGLRKSDKELFDICYKAKQMQQLKSLSQRYISVENELKKQAAIELQKVQAVLAQKKQDFERRLVDRKKMADLEPQTKRLQTNLASSQKEYQDIKKKNDISQNNYRKLRQQILRYTLELELDKEQNRILLEKQKQLLPQVNAIEAEMSKEQVDLEVKSRQLERQKQQFYQSKEKLLKMQQELRYLTSKYEFLQSNVNIDQEMQNLRIQELKGISQNNSMVNEVIGDMMSKFEQMRKFARDGSTVINP